ncbi:MAG: hypothetical protein KJO57_05555 [Deltaproteobacteria bacterium]|nr:hypothetical protein [Deltaproteobacteria bacterium]
MSRSKSRQPGDLRLAATSLYTTYGELRKIGGAPQPVPKGQLIQRYEALDWRPTFVELSRIACVIANDEDGPSSSRVRQMVGDPLAAETNWLGRALRSSADVLIAHEEGIHFAEAMTLVYSAEVGGRSPGPGEVAKLLLMGNDYCSTWRDDSEQGLTRAESSLAGTVRARRLNRYGMRHLDFLRSAALFQTPPPRDAEWCRPELWQRFQREAFGMPFEEYFETFAGILAALSYTWGQPRETGELPSPSVEPSVLFALPGMAAEKLTKAFSELVVTRDQFVDDIGVSRGDEDLPLGPAIFSRKPFIEVDDGTFAAASPWAVREHLRGGLWARHLSAAKDGDGGADRWFTAFGDLFESWCRSKAALASDAGLSDRLIMSDSIGDPDEIEDVVFQDTYSGKRVALFSVKASMVPESAIKEARSPRGVVDWYERFLFARPTTKGSGRRYREGAVRSLDKTVQSIRSGRYKPKIPVQATIFPVVVTYDDLGEHAGLYQWVRKRCNQEKLLQGNKVRPVTFLSATDFEDLLEVAELGTGVLKMLEIKTRGTNAEARFDVVLDHEIAWVPGKGRRTRDELSTLIMRLVERAQQPLKETS